MNQIYLNEERYQKNKKKLAIISLIILFIGLGLGIYLISIGIDEKQKNDSKYSEENKQQQINKIDKELEMEITRLKEQKSELEKEGITYSGFTTYNDGKSYDLKIIVNALDPSFNYCAFDEYKNHSITKKYCSLKSELKEVETLNIDYQKKFNSYDSTKYFMFGGFIIIVSIMFSGSIYMFTKRREIVAFTTQQVMPIAQEGIEKITPTMAKTAKKMVEEVGPTVGEIAKDMAPVYGKIAKEVTKGIKEGMKEEK